MRRFDLILLAGVSALSSSIVYAQDAPAAGDNSTNGGASAAATPAAQSSTAGVGDIIVTAQRRAQNLLSVPLAIQATTGQQLNNSGIREISSLQYTTPGMLVDDGVGYTQIYIRGIGNSLFVGADPSVVTFIDDVPRIYGTAVNNFVNVERVEVLKGAQGGLYGRNATGGVINIITKQPSDKPEAEAKVDYGEKDTLRAAAYINVPLTDHIAINMSVERDLHAPYVKNLAQNNSLTAANFLSGTPSGNPFATTICGASSCTPQQTAAFVNRGTNAQPGYGNQNFWALDSKLRLRFTDNFKITLDSDYSKKHDSDGDQWFLSTPAYSQAVYAGTFTAVTGIPITLPAGFFQLPHGKFTDYNSTIADAWLVDYGGSAKAEWSLPGVDITDIFGYRAQHSLYDQNYAYPLTYDVPIVSNHKWYWYEELRAQSTGAGPFHFLGGATYLRDHFHGDTENILLPPFPGLSTLTETHDDVRNWSVYGQVGYDLTEKLNLTASGRYIHETNTNVFLPGPGTGLTSSVSTTIQAQKFVPAATLSYKLEGGGNIYARYAQGWKTGGINPVVPPGPFIAAGSTYGEVFGPETVDTYEIGAKDQFFDHKLAVTADVFFNNYKNLQTTATAQPVFQTDGLILAEINAGTARSYGVEGSVNWRVTRPVTLGVNAGYLNAKYKQFGNSNTAVLEPFNFSHQTMLFSPKWQMGFTADLDQPLNDRLRLIGSLLTSYISKTTAGLSSVVGVPDNVIPAYWLTNLRLGVKTTDDHVGVFLVVTNLFNKGYFTYGSTGSTGNNLMWGDPRIISGEVQFKF